MPTAFDNKFRPMALRMLEGYGAPGVYKSLNPETYDTANGTTNASYTNYSVKTLLSSASKGWKPGGGEARDEMVTALVAALDLPVTPKTGDVLDFDGAERRVVRGLPTYSGEQIALWTLQLAN